MLGNVSVRRSTFWTRPSKDGRAGFGAPHVKPQDPAVHFSRFFSRTAFIPLPVRADGPPRPVLRQIHSKSACKRRPLFLGFSC